MSNTWKPWIKKTWPETVETILESGNPKRLIIAGPGTGKTFSFKKLLDALPDKTPSRRLVLTFIDELVKDLQKELGTRATVCSFHEYCHDQLRALPGARGAHLSESFEYYPLIRSLIRDDWELLGNTPAKFAPLLRKAEPSNEEERVLIEFFISRGNYYDAVGWDDSIARLLMAYRSDSKLIPSYDLVIVDEVQDFNSAEVALIELLGTQSKVVAAGDDDQALYGDLRDASADHIRAIEADVSWESFTLPDCRRCPAAVVEAVNAILVKAEEQTLFSGRLAKPFRTLANPERDKAHPKINVLTAQSLDSNCTAYTTYLSEQIGAIPKEVVDRSHAGGHPTALIIAPGTLHPAILKALASAGFSVEVKEKTDDEREVGRRDGLRMLRDHPKSNLGWRIILEDSDDDALREDCLKRAGQTAPLAPVIPEEFKTRILAEASAYQHANSEKTEGGVEREKPRIRLTTFPGCKGLSAEHVFIMGVERARVTPPADEWVSKFIVALTRTRTQCHILSARKINNRKRYVSPVVAWIPDKLRQAV